MEPRATKDTFFTRCLLALLFIYFILFFFFLLNFIYRRMLRSSSIILDFEVLILHGGISKLEAIETIGQQWQKKRDWEQHGGRFN